MAKKIAIVITSGALITEVIWQLYKAYKRYRDRAVSNAKTEITETIETNTLCKNTKTETKFFEVMFFSRESAICRPHLIRREACDRVNCAVRYFWTITDYLSSATDTLDICMYFFTSKYLARVIANARSRGVVVRVITDASMTQNEENQIFFFYKEGIKLKLKEMDVLMHHKFVIIDNNILITGSMNWTLSAFFGNFENLLVTNEPALVCPFVNEFERIWLTHDVTPRESSRPYIDKNPDPLRHSMSEHVT